MTQKIGLVLGTVAGLLPWLLVLALVLVVAVFMLQRFGLFGQQIQLPPGSVLIPEGEDGRTLEAFTFTRRDGIQALTDPRFVTADEAEERGQLVPSEFVIGLSINGDSKAYPVNVLSQHEIINDTVGVVPVAVTF